MVFLFLCAVILEPGPNIVLDLGRSGKEVGPCAEIRQRLLSLKSIGFFVLSANWICCGQFHLKGWSLRKYAVFNSFAKLMSSI